jgi:hypothetical protein
VLEFKREKVWGRIRFNDVLRIFTDTIAIFYRLRILRYYDTERPPWVRNDSRVLVLIRGSLPSDDVLRRLSIDTDTHIAYISEKSPEAVYGNVIHFLNEAELKDWLSRTEHAPGIIGFLGYDCIPVGSWVKNALRNFQDEHVDAVCGPVVPGTWKSMAEKVAAMLYSSSLTSGPNSYLYSIRQVRQVKIGLMDNIFLRTSLWGETDEETRNFAIHRGIFLSVSSEDCTIKYDPDVAVSKQIPMLFFPYLEMVASKSFQEGFTIFKNFRENNRLWTILPFVLWLIVSGGWFVLPAVVYFYFILIYVGIIFLWGLSYCEPFALPLFCIGILVDHVARAVMVPAGMIWRLLKGSGKE